MTAADLLAALRAAGCEPAVAGEDLVFAADVPAALDAYLAVLHTGVRALLAGRRWAGFAPTTGRPRWLSPAARVPAGIGYLTVEGDATWDRLPPGARRDAPKAFAG